MVRTGVAAGGALLLAACLLLGGCSRQEAAWRDASQADTAAAYGVYLEAYPAGTHAAQARRRMDDLREQQAWQQALRFDAPESYQRYLALHPEGRYAAQAHERLAAFLRTRPAPVSTPAGEATPPPAAPVAGTLIAAAQDAGYRIQLGAFGDGEQAAREAWRALRDRHPQWLGELAPRIDVVVRDGRSLWRLQAGPVSEPRARELCAALVARGADCIVVPG